MLDPAPVVAAPRGTAAAQHLDALDGLRALAIVLVLVHHLTPGGDPNQGVRALVFKLAQIGWSGVDLFFVLSGFLITGILLRGKAAGRPMSSFLMRRVLRIVPAYYLALLLVLVVVPLLTGAYPVPDVWLQAPWWLYVSNMFPANFEVLGGLFGMSHFWSLAVEMQFYLLWPLLVYRLSPQALVRAALGGLALALVARAAAVALGAGWKITYAWMPMHMDGLLAGALVALAVHRGVVWARVRGWVWAALAVGSLIVGWVMWFGHGSAVFKSNELLLHSVLRICLPSVFAMTYAACLWAALQPNALGRALSHPALEPVARYSYGLYIVHYLLMPWYEQTFGPQVLVQYLGGRDLPVYAYLILASGISYAIAMVSYHGFEQRFLRLKVKF
jgi:peptidoglycan/LPS O-acetylase OafA/YrhL